MELPFFDQNDFMVNKNNLYHYTSCDKACKILESMSLKPSRFVNLNDLNEARLEHLNCNIDIIPYININKRIRNNCFVLCFCRDNLNKRIGRNASMFGTNHPAMWAHYANNNSGICIVIDKKRFISKNKDIFNKHKCWYRFCDVSYKEYIDSQDIIYHNEPIDEFINKNSKELFFTKHKDWSYEKEHRLLIHSKTIAKQEDFLLNIEGCIRYIVLGKKMLDDNSTELKKLLNCLLDYKNKCYNKFNRFSFGINEHGSDGYPIFEANGFFNDNLMDGERLQNEYYQWIKT